MAMADKIIYGYSLDTNEYTGSFPAQKHPFREGVWLVPENSTETPPPNHGKNEMPIWNGKGWDIVQDYRGEQWYQDGIIPVVIKEFGDPTKKGLTKEQVIPKRDPLEMALAATQFYHILLVLGYTQSQVISAFSDKESFLYIENEFERDEATIHYQNGLAFKIDDLILRKIVEHDKIPDKQINELWKWERNAL